MKVDLLLDDHNRQLILRTLRKMKNEIASNRRIFFLVTLIIYLIIVFWLLFFQVGSTVRASYFDSRKVHLVPFESSFNSIKLAITNNFAPPHKTHYRYVTIRNLIGNILLFLPWGFLAPLLFPHFRKFRTILIFTACCSVAIEIMQFVFVVGVADIDDVLLNLVGTTIGFYIHICLNKYGKTNSSWDKYGSDWTGAVSYRSKKSVFILY